MVLVFLGDGCGFLVDLRGFRMPRVAQQGSAFAEFALENEFGGGWIALIVSGDRPSGAICGNRFVWLFGAKLRRRQGHVHCYLHLWPFVFLGNSQGRSSVLLCLCHIILRSRLSQSDKVEAK